MATQGDEFPAEVGFAAIFAASPDGLLVVDGSGRIRLANPAVEHMFGYAAGELIGQAIEVLSRARAKAFCPAKPEFHCPSSEKSPNERSKS